MRLLLDTHAYLWLATAPKKVGKRARELVASGEHEVFLSVISLAEIAIKRALGKIDFDFALIEESADNLGARLLDFNLAHVRELSRLPLIHHDPFDRFLIAQSRAENCTLLTMDPQIQRYECAWLWE